MGRRADTPGRFAGARRRTAASRNAGSDKNERDVALSKSLLFENIWIFQFNLKKGDLFPVVPNTEDLRICVESRFRIARFVASGFPFFLKVFGRPYRETRMQLSGFKLIFYKGFNNFRFKFSNMGLRLLSNSIS